jgi:nitroimidazol reductase NimA-like FMN-containing flavoprotein (pyridoxamine 5'-phosphate oxidase superfamily)
MTTSPDESVLAPPRCWELLRTAEVGRLAVTVAGQPEIFPVAYVVDHGSVVFRTSSGTKLAAIRGSAVAFEADGVEAGGVEAAIAWSVVVKGRAQEVTDPRELVAAARLPLYPLHPSAKPHVVRVVPHRLTGRSFALHRELPDPVRLGGSAG